MRMVACPVVTRSAPTGEEILVFEHPLAGYQLVKGGIEEAESASAAALRELQEEAGVTGVAMSLIAHSTTIHTDEDWHFIQVALSLDDTNRENWVHHCADDGGHDFTFCWHPLEAALPTPHHDRFARALTFVRKHVI